MAPGIDIERDILAHMAFKPIIEKPMPMDPRIFRDEPMELLADLLNLNLHDARQLRRRAATSCSSTSKAGASARRATSTTCRRCSSRPAGRPGKRVNAVINHDGFRIAEDLYDDYAEMVAVPVRRTTT